MSNLETLASDNLDYQNFFSTTLTSDMTDSDTDVFLDSVPTPTEGVLVIDWDVPAKREVIFYTSKTSSKVVCHAQGRGFDSSSAVEHTSGANVIMAPVAEWFRYVQYLATNTPLGWSAVGDTPDTVTNNGNRRYDLVFNSADLTDTLGVGMKLKLTRTVAAPDQCAALTAASSHSFSRASASLTGVSFTDDFTVMAWVKVDDYAATRAIISRYDGTDGWSFRITSDGQVELFGNNSGGGNYRRIRSNSAIPLGQWVHVAATLDMSANTGDVYINGVQVQNYLDGAQTSLLQGGGNLEIGSRNGAEFFDGSIAQVAVFSSELTEATVQDYMTHGLAGTETDIVCAYSLDNDITDLSANNNDMTANNGAVATSNDSPFCNSGASTTIDYAIITAITYSTNTTVSVKTGLNDTLPTTGGVSSVEYSTSDQPYGLPPEEIMNPWEWFETYWGFVTIGGATIFGKRRVKGDSVELFARFVVSGSTTVLDGFGFKPQTSGVEASEDLKAHITRFGEVVVRDNSAGISYMGHVTPNGDDRFRPSVQTASATYTYATLVAAAVPMTFATDDYIEITCEYQLKTPI